jgi:hypothetical protein
MIEKIEVIHELSYFGIRDTKSRRRINASNELANITADEIEAGVTIEKLESINVPVFCYGTQITIHGKLPDLKTGLCAGYKSLFENSNGTIGVKYIAIDAEKKLQISEAAYYSKVWFFRQTSQETTLTISFKEKNECLECLKSIPESYFIGSKQAYRDCIYGGYFIVVTISAIPVENMDIMIKWVSCGMFEDVTSLDSHKEQERIDREIEMGAKD